MKYRCYTFLGFTTTSLVNKWLPSPLPLEKEAWALSFVSSTLAFLPVCNTIGPQNRQSVKAFCLAIYGVRVDTAKVCGKHHYKMNARISNCQLVFVQLLLKGRNFSFPLIPVFELPGIWRKGEDPLIRAVLFCDARHCMHFSEPRYLTTKIVLQFCHRLIKRKTFDLNKQGAWQRQRRHVCKNCPWRYSLSNFGLLNDSLT